MGILAAQLLIAVIIFSSSLFGKKVTNVVVFLCAVWTIFMVFMPYLMIIQFIVIFSCYSITNNIHDKLTSIKNRNPILGYLVIFFIWFIVLIFIWGENEALFVITMAACVLLQIKLSQRLYKMLTLKNETLKTLILVVSSILSFTILLVVFWFIYYLTAGIYFSIRYHNSQMQRIYEIVLNEIKYFIHHPLKYIIIKYKSTFNFFIDEFPKIKVVKWLGP